MKKTYRNSIKSKQAIRNAFIELLAKKKDINQISVSEIVEKADINRGTFYNHYNNIMDVINEMEDELIEKLSDSLKIVPSTNDINSFVETIFSYFKDNEIIYRKICGSLTKSIIDKLKFRFVARLKSLYQNIDEIMLMFVVNGLAGVYIDYLENSLHVSLEQLKESSIKILKNYLLNQR